MNLPKERVVSELKDIFRTELDHMDDFTSNNLTIIINILALLDKIWTGSFFLVEPGSFKEGKSYLDFEKFLKFLKGPQPRSKAFDYLVKDGDSKGSRKYVIFNSNIVNHQTRPYYYGRRFGRYRRLRRPVRPKTINNTDELKNVLGICSLKNGNIGFMKLNECDRLWKKNVQKRWDMHPENQLIIYHNWEIKNQNKTFLKYPLISFYYSASSIDYRMNVGNAFGMAKKLKNLGKLICPDCSHLISYESKNFADVKSD